MSKVISFVTVLAVASVMFANGVAGARVSHGYSEIFSLDTVTTVDENMNGPPQATTITAIFPNPFNPLTTISFALAESGHVELAVFDLRGRLVRVLDREQRLAGYYRIEWSGRDDLGRLVPAGIYFCQLNTPQGSQTMKMTLAR